MILEEAFMELMENIRTDTGKDVAVRKLGPEW
jgi:hypothetical protein